MEETAEVAVLLSGLVKAIVRHPANVALQVVSDESGQIFRVIVDPRDRGAVIGAQGRMARSIRTVLQAISMKSGKKLSFDIADN